MIWEIPVGPKAKDKAILAIAASCTRCTKDDPCVFCLYRDIKAENADLRKGNEALGRKYMAAKNGDPHASPYADSHKRRLRLCQIDVARKDKRIRDLGQTIRDLRKALKSAHQAAMAERGKA